MVRIIKVSSACANILFNKESYNLVVTIYKTIKEKIHIYIYVHVFQTEGLW